MASELLEVDGAHDMNSALCDFQRRWRLDGDYLRCRSCHRPQLAGYADNPFPHAADCLPGKHHRETHPWRIFLSILGPLTATQPATPGGEQEGGR